jgi:hypothetical protein
LQVAGFNWNKRGFSAGVVRSIAMIPLNGQKKHGNFNAAQVVATIQVSLLDIGER